MPQLPATSDGDFTGRRCNVGGRGEERLGWTVRSPYWRDAWIMSESKKSPEEKHRTQEKLQQKANDVLRSG